MKIYTLTTKEPNVIGEHLRNEFFVQYHGDTYVGRGCYSIFKLHDGVCELGMQPVNDADFDIWKVYCKRIGNETITMRYFWDGDGVLEFIFADGAVLRNDDCKKDYNWTWYNEHEEISNE